jgi:hypothetical protein
VHNLPERSIWWAVWDLGLVVACPVHGCLLLNQCAACKRKIAWERPAVHQCRCGFDLREISADPADPDLVALNAIIYRAAKSTQIQMCEIDVDDFDFPPELHHLKLLLARLTKGASCDGNSGRFAPRISHLRLQSAMAQSRCCETGPGSYAKCYTG